MMSTKLLDSTPTEIIKKIVDSDWQKRPRGCKKKKGITYYDIHSAFDIEAYNDVLRERATMYIWQFAADDTWFYGRTWQEFREFIENLNKAMYKDFHCVVWVHNLSYEFQFLKSVLDFEPQNVFAMKQRKILYATYKNIEFRCSYLQTNRSLYDLGKAYNVEHLKLSGEEYDYRKERYPWTPLKEKEIEYSGNDVLGLTEAMKIHCGGETFYTLPFTSTGYVRRDVRSAMYKHRKWLVGIQPSEEEYLLLKELFRGGNTHANRNYTNKILTNVLSMDKKSSYPSVMLYNEYPMTNFIKVDGKVDIKDALKLIYKRHKAVIVRVRFFGLTLKDDENGFPDLSKSKCRNVHGEIEDNGRLLYCDVCDTTLNDIDLKIIIDQYRYTDIKVLELWAADYGRLPDDFINVIKKYFYLKTALDGVEGQEIEYMKSKNKLNASFGMTVQSEDNELLEYDPVTRVFKAAEKDIGTLLDEAHKAPYKVYSWGVWVTSHARYELMRGLKAAGKNAVYCDTDSVKFHYETEEEKALIMSRFEAINKEYLDLGEQYGGTAVKPDGEKVCLGVYELDGDYTLFKTLGAKKYIVNDRNKGLKLTCAGVSKKKGLEELQASALKLYNVENKTNIEIKDLPPEMVLQQFKIGYIFTMSAGLDASYDDTAAYVDIVDGHEIEVSSNVLLTDSTYTVSLTAEYDRIVNDPVVWREYVNAAGIWKEENKKKRRKTNEEQNNRD